MDDETNNINGSDESPLEPWVDPALEARIVALILGEASDFERSELLAAIAAQPELKAFYDRIQGTHASLQRAESPTPRTDSSWKLPAEKRDALLEKFRNVPAQVQASSNGPAISSRRSRRWAPLAIAATVALLITGVAVIRLTGIRQYAAKSDYAVRETIEISESETSAIALGSEVTQWNDRAEDSSNSVRLAKNFDSINRDRLDIDRSRTIARASSPAADTSWERRGRESKRFESGLRDSTEEAREYARSVDAGSTGDWDQGLPEVADGLFIARSSSAPAPAGSIALGYTGKAIDKDGDASGTERSEELFDVAQNDHFYALKTRSVKVAAAKSPGVVEGGEEDGAETDEKGGDKAQLPATNLWAAFEDPGASDTFVDAAGAALAQPLQPVPDLGTTFARAGLRSGSEAITRASIDGLLVEASRTAGTVTDPASGSRLYATVDESQSTTPDQSRGEDLNDPGARTRFSRHESVRMGDASKPKGVSVGGFAENDKLVGATNLRGNDYRLAGGIAEVPAASRDETKPEAAASVEAMPAFGLAVPTPIRPEIAARASGDISDAKDNLASLGNLTAGFGGGGVGGGGGGAGSGQELGELEEEQKELAELVKKAPALGVMGIDADDDFESGLPFTATAGVEFGWDSNATAEAEPSSESLQQLGQGVAGNAVRSKPFAGKGFGEDITSNRESQSRADGEALGGRTTADGELTASTWKIPGHPGGVTPSDSIMPAEPEMPAIRELESFSVMADTTVKEALKKEELEADSPARLGQIALQRSAPEELKTVLESKISAGEKDAEVAAILDTNAIAGGPLPPDHAKDVEKVERFLSLAEGYSDIEGLDLAEKQLNEALSIDKYNETARRKLEDLEVVRQGVAKTGRDQIRAKMLADVDELWEAAVPEITFEERKPESGVINNWAENNVENYKGKRGWGAYGGTRLFSADLDGIKDLEFKERNGEIASIEAKNASVYSNWGFVVLGEGERRGLTSRSRLTAAKPGSKVSDTVETDPTSKKAQPDLSLETLTSAEPFSTFSLSVSDVSFKLASASLLEQNAFPPADKVRVEEFVNAFDYGDSAPSLDEKVSCQVDQAAHPFLQQRNLMRVSMRTAAEGRAASQPLRLTILLDKSGSMERADREESVLLTMQALAKHLGPADKITAVAFARQPHLIADQLSGDRAKELVGLVAATPSEGGTNLEEALKLADTLATRQFDEGATNRIVLITDGAANLGDADPESLKEKVIELRQRGIAFDACGVGADGLNDTTLEALTRKGDGRYYFLNRPQDADANFVRQLAGSLRPAAKNVKVQVKFNPERVTRYRLAGFEKHRLKKEDFRNDKVDAAEMAAAESGNALYQFEADPQGSGDVGEVFVRFLDTSTKQMVERSWPIPYQPKAPRLEDATPTMQLAATAGLLGEKLKGGPTAEAITLEDLSPVTNQLRSTYANDQRVQQLIQMVEKTRSLSP